MLTLDILTAKEQFILTRLAQGFTLVEIAKELELDKRTLSNYIGRIRIKYGGRFSTRKLVFKYYKFLYPDLRVDCELKIPKVSKKLREVLILHAKGNSYAEISTILLISKNCVASRMRHLMKALKARSKIHLTYLWLQRINPGFHVPEPKYRGKK